MKVANGMSWRIVGSLCAVLALGATSFAQPAKPAAGALERAMKYAPDGAAGVIHVEVKALAKDLLAGVVKGMEPNAIPPELIQAANKLAEKIDSVDVFILPGSPPTPLVVVHGELTPADVNAALKTIPDLTPGWTLQKGENGRYAFDDGKPLSAPVTVLVGGEAPELPAGVLVGGLTPLLTKENLAGLGKGKNEELAKLLKGVDTAAPIWGAALTEKVIPTPDAPTAISGGLYLLGGGESKVAIEFRSAGDANLFMFIATEEPNLVKSEGSSPVGRIIRSIAEYKQEGTLVTMTSKTKDSLVPMIVEGLVQARAAAKRTVSMSQLRSLASGCHGYAASRNGQFPPDWQTLLRVWYHNGDANTKIPEGTASLLISPLSGKKAKMLESGEFGFEPDYVYVKYPMKVDAIVGAATKVLAYERPENYKNEQTAVLFVDGHVEMMKIDAFQKRLKETQDWIGAQEKKDK